MRGPPSARVAKCVSPRKMRGPTQGARAALWMRGTASARTRARCVGRGSIARAALSARAAIAWRGEWAALPTHLPSTCHSMPTQCNRGSTRVGRDEPQSPGTLRVKFCWYGLIFFISIPTTKYRCAHYARQLLCHSIAWCLNNLIYHFYIVSLLPYGEKVFGSTLV